MILMQMEWWGSLTQIEQIFWGIALISTALFLIQVVMAFIGLDPEFDVDVDVDDGGFGIISIRGILAFLVFFGWGSIVGLEMGLNPAKSGMFGFLMGFIAMIAIAWIFSKMLKMQEIGTLSLKNTVDEVGEVYLTIPEQSKGKGKIHISIKGSLLELDAISESRQLEYGEKVKVLNITDENILVVKALDEIDFSF